MKSSYNIKLALTLLSIFSILLLSTFISTRSLQLTHVIISEKKNTTELLDGHIKQNDNLTVDNDERMNITLPKIDFAIYGFPKTGTTTLLNALERHTEVFMPPSEFCQLHQEGGDKSWANYLLKHSPESIQTTKQKCGIKCPAFVRLPSATENLLQVSDNVRLIIGLRHPVNWFQSFYNYRVWEHFKYNMTNLETIPKPFELMNGRKHWRVVTTALARYEEYLMQLDKVALTSKERYNMQNGIHFWPRKIVPNNYKVFLYIDEQLKDRNKERRMKLQRDLQHYLGLNSPIEDFGKMKANSNQDWYKEYIDICDTQYSKIRDELLQQTIETTRWIKNKFIKSDDVYVSGKKIFLSALDSFNEDPCAVTNNTSKEADDAKSTSIKKEVIRRSKAVLVGL